MATSTAWKKRGALLQLLREEAKLEQQDVAEALGVSRVTVSRWETGATRIKSHVERELVMLYMSRGAKPEPQAMAAAGLDIPKRTSERQPESGPYDYAVVQGPVVVREPAGTTIVPPSELAGYAKAILHILQSVVSSQQTLVASLEQQSVPAPQADMVDELTPPVSREKLDATVRRQLAKDAEEERPRRRKAAG
ncbi:helix-turn-helix transcriptional regulator [Gemmatimonas sp.]|uniref:helix-turn-helix transcriptional regulator n=1 Tax=Gemmatimonas sp. TaxID=1962908 RepID=UPI0025C1AFA1|nr:helix-turn-helix transcriptional regulator [Gemmatimonas sp.]MCA2992047.1 helix-turn-helix transcriptional regulator [Gemmatimonas sp.]